MSSSKSSPIVGTTRDDIAIVGMACRFPGAHTPQAFWDNLVRGRSSVREIDDSRWCVADHYSPDPLADDCSVSKWAGLVDGIDRFDAAFFKISPREAALMDPQQRIMLELSWSCLEDAGYAPATLRGSSTAVYVGVCNYDYKELLEKVVHPIEGHISTGSYTALIPNRISYEFDFRGTSVPVDTACSSSLVALHEAVHALRRGDCDNALVGGISILCSPTYFIAFSKLGMLSPNGQCRTFDENADGYVRGEGAGMLMLKPLGAALEHGDRIHAVIRGTGVNHGGKAPTLTSPNPYAQAKVIADTCERAGVSPDTIGYIEAHGTGTPKGDPIEIAGLKRAFAALERSFGVAVPSGACGLGSVKTNIGHLESASGIAGVIKTLLAIRHRMLPPLLNFEELNKRIDLKGSPFQIVDTLREWIPSAAGSPLRAGVSSFGFGGVNAHVVIDEYRQGVHAPHSLAPLPVVLSARTEERLRAHALALLTHLERQPRSDGELSRIARTLNSREAMEWRAVCTVRTTDELVAALRQLAQEPGGDAIGTPELLRCHVGSAADELKAFIAKPDTAGRLRSWIAARDFGNTAAWWVRGLSVDWSFVFAGTPGGLPSLIDLPSYPFLGRRHWIEQPDSPAALAASAREPSQVWSLDESWPAVAVPDIDAALDEDTLLVTLVDDAAARCIHALHPLHPVIELRAPANPGDGESWVDAYVRNIDAIKTGIKKQPRRLLLLSNTHHDVASFLFPAIQAVQKELQLPARWFSWESGLAAGKAVPRALRQASSGPWGAGRFRLRELAGEPICEHLQWTCAPLRPAAPRSRIRHAGVYWITGGNGGLGRKIAALLATRYDATVIVSGRSDPETAEPVTFLRAAGAKGQVIYRRADCTRADEMQALSRWITQTHGPLNGVIHAAGVVRDRSVFFKQRAEIDAVMLPKVAGALLLDEATRHCDLDLFILFSSVTGVFGNPGQSDYAAGNGFLSSFAARRRQRVAEGERHGLTQVVHWPYWAAGGMRLEASLIRSLEQSLGIVPLGDDDGLAAFEALISRDVADACLMPGRRDTVLAAVNGSARPTIAAAPAAPAARRVPSASSNDSPAAIEATLAQVLSELTRLDVAEIDAAVHFADYGVDSILLQSFVQRVNAVYGIDLKPLQFHQCRNIVDLAELVHGPRASTPRSSPAQAPTRSPATQVDPSADIAIIGMDIRLPNADTLDDFWALFSGAPAEARPYPRERWDSLPSDLTRGHRREDCCGVFFDDIQGFDHRLFNISAREAMLMDPQQRLLLQSIWRVIESSGYNRQEFARRRTSVLLSIGQVDYEEVVRCDRHLDEFAASGTSRYIAANRLSHFFDLSGMSEPVDTACSSVLVALGRAVDSLRKGAVDQAIVAGVQLNISPTRFRMLRERGLLSQQGRTLPFDARSDGFIRSEGVGALVLKPLRQALADRDHVHGVLRGTGVWHAGKSLGVTSPSSPAHQEAMKQALADAALPANALHCIEAHGTGMSLGDASEIDAFETVLATSARDGARPCILGASKSVLGHLEAASGIAAVMKAALALEHGSVPGICSFDALHPAIDAKHFRPSATAHALAASPGQGAPCIGVHSYGLGGVSAFAVLQGHANRAIAPTSGQSARLFVLSSRSRKALDIYLGKVVRFLDPERPRAYSFDQLTSVFQRHREAMPCRIAVLASGLDELASKLHRKLAGLSVPDFFEGHAAQQAPLPADTVQRWVDEGRWPEVAGAWVGGQDVPWPSLDVARYPFPVYAFDDERGFWVSRNDTSAAAEASHDTSGMLPA